MKRLIGGGMGIIFKGSGFYSTDHRKSSAASGPISGGNGSSSKGSESKESSSKTEAKTESKPESSGTKK